MSLTTKPPSTSESLNESNTSQATKCPTPGPTYDWNTAMLISEALACLILVTLAWLFVSMVIYGTKTGRWWNKAGSSSLSSGSIFTTCVITTGLTIVSLAISVAIHHVPALEYPDIYCMRVNAVNDVVDTFFFYTAYLFLAILQRQLYTHPSVKDHVNPCVNRIRVATIIFYTLMFAILVFQYFWLVSELYQYCENVRSCVLVQIGSLFSLQLYAYIVMNLNQVIMIALTIYPAFCARFPSVTENPDKLNGNSSNTRESHSTDKMNCFKRFYVNISNPNAYVSPIQACVKRAVWCAAVIFLLFVMSVIYDFSISEYAPTVIIRIPTYIIGLFFPFCMLFTFPFASSVLTLCVPSCSTRSGSTRNPDARFPPANQTAAA